MKTSPTDDNPSLKPLQADEKPKTQVKDAKSSQKTSKASPKNP
jgi:hypothetical protein